MRGRAGNRIRIPVIHDNSVAYLYCDRAEIVSIIHFPLDFPYCNAARATFGMGFEISHPDLKSGRSPDLRPSRVDFETRLRIGVRFSD